MKNKPSAALLARQKKAQNRVAREQEAEDSVVSITDEDSSDNDSDGDEVSEGRIDRGKDGRFLKGNIANPKGGPRKDVDLVHACRKLTQRGLDKLVRVISYGKDRDALDAIKIIFAYGYGKPRETVDANINVCTPASILEEVERRCQALEAGHVIDVSPVDSDEYKADADDNDTQ